MRRSRIGHRKGGEGLEEKKAKYSVGDKVTTREDVPALNEKGKRRVTAMAGWVWTVRVVDKVPTEHGRSFSFEYVVVAGAGLYHQRLKEKQIAGKVKPKTTETVGKTVSNAQS